ncbi:MAG: hypothetical protein MJ245_05415 [Clostridia bacterium]|nr:hypothetical protein [Clostridia bacterium]
MIATRIESNKILKLIVVLALLIAAIVLPVALYLLLQIVKSNMALGIILAAITMAVALISLTYILFVPKYIYDIIRGK